ncbi:MAG: argininosuccinate lyase, partial [Bacteroidales bacterium]
FIPAFNEIKEVLAMTNAMMAEVTVNREILKDAKYAPIFSVESVNELAAAGVPFRDAYKKVGLEIEAGRFVPNTDINHTHEGSIGNLCNDKIVELYESVLEEFDFGKYQAAFNGLLNI